MYGYHSFLGAGQETRPYGVSGEIQQNLTAGGASPSPTRRWGNIPWRRIGGRHMGPSVPVYGNSFVRRAPDPHPLPRLVGTRRGGEMEQAEILHRIRAQWPGRNHTRNRILRAGNFAEGCRGIPRRWGSGGGATMGGDAHRSPPLAAFWSLCRRGQRDSPRRAKPCEAARRVIAPYGCHGPWRTGGPGTRPYGAIWAGLYTGHHRSHGTDSISL